LKTQRFLLHRFLPSLLLLAPLVGPTAVTAQPGWDPAKTLDIGTLTAGTDPLIRVSGAAGEFRLGVVGLPVAGGFDMDGDGFQDYASGYMTAAPFGRFIAAGEFYITFGDGTASRAVDTAVVQPDVLRITGAVAWESTANELWMADVTGDGLGDLLVSRQNFDPGSRPGAGALTVVVGGPGLRALAAAGQIIDLAAPPPSVTLFTVVGNAIGSRLGIWARAGDVDGDGIDDLAVAADQEGPSVFDHNGAVYVIRGGSHLAQTTTLDLANFGSTPFAGNVARLVAPAGTSDYHLGATCQVADLDGNGRAEVLAGATINRAGAGLTAPGDFWSHADGGAPQGNLYIAWDDLFSSSPWAAGYTIDVGAGGPSLTTLRGGVQNISFGEEIVGGLDYDGDGHGDLFIGDLVGDGTDAQDRPVSGVGYLLSRAERLKGLDFNIDAPPPATYVSKILGPNSGAIGADTVAHGDFDADGIADLAIGSPHGQPQGRINAGVVHILFGRQGHWPKRIDTAPGQFPPAARLRITELQGALGRDFSRPSPIGPFDEGDTLCYSAAAGDVDGDGRTDLITNEMVGNGIGPAAIDVGNLIILSGDLLTAPKFNQGQGD
jgi:hypothetical protein